MFPANPALSSISFECIHSKHTYMCNFSVYQAKFVRMANCEYELKAPYGRYKSKYTQD